MSWKKLTTGMALAGVIVAISLGGQVQPVAAESSRPHVRLHVSPDSTNTGSTIDIHVKASDHDRLRRVEWWATDSNGNTVKDREEKGCDDSQTCSHSWQTSFGSTGTYTIHAEAVSRTDDQTGHASDTVTVS
jgi:Big-like domain-containing protein